MILRLDIDSKQYISMSYDYNAKSGVILLSEQWMNEWMNELMGHSWIYWQGWMDWWMTKSFVWWNSFLSGTLAPVKVCSIWDQYLYCYKIQCIILLTSLICISCNSKLALREYVQHCWMLIWNWNILVTFFCLNVIILYHSTNQVIMYACKWRYFAMWKV